ncbi:MAG TPA: hypothetical protein VI757_05785 [Bacteroidia bacterium]|nr:hypothetical protein [Bacteroidia bacterium]
MAGKLDKNSVSLAGEFAVLSQLILRGYDANLTLGHTKGVDILVSNPKSGKMFKLEVKTNYRNISSKGSNSGLFGKFVSAWTMSKKHESIIDSNLYYCFVNINKSNRSFRFFILPSSIVAQYVGKQHKLWLKENRNHRDTDLRKFRIGFRKESYRMSTPTVEEYENNWELK